MQIYHFTLPTSIVLSILLWAFFHYSIAVVSGMITDDFYKFNNWLFRPLKFEKNGTIYKSLFKIKKWKKHLPDASSFQQDGYNKKNLNDMSVKNLDKFLLESCRAEFCHILTIFPFIFFGLFLPPIIVFGMFCYAVFVNLPFVLAQRYNRPRIIKFKNRIEQRENAKKKENMEIIKPSFQKMMTKQ
ncbi:MAG: hypothetical protein ACRCUP_07980 [Mycoplasmatales bacterium]